MIHLHAAVWFVFAQSAGYAAARPAECRLADGLRAGNRWERAKEPNLHGYCALLASGTAKLVNAGPLVRDVPAIADQADKLVAGHAAPAILRGRALLRLGKAEEARQALELARSRDGRALDDPAALLAWARANARTGHREEAARAYRAVLTRTDSLSTLERDAAPFEAGMVVMAEGTAALADALAMLRQAHHGTHDVMHVASLAGLALALDRSGRKDEAGVLLAAERAGESARAALREARVLEALADAGVAHEVDSLLAVALAANDPAGAREAWARYLEGAGGKGPWGDHARLELSALGRGRPRADARPSKGPR